MPAKRPGKASSKNSSTARIAHATSRHIISTLPSSSQCAFPDQIERLRGAEAKATASIHTLRPADNDMLDFDVAQAQLAEAGNAPRQTEDCTLHEAQGRILAKSLTAHLDMPPADNSAMDGYAIRFADYQPGHGLPVQQRSYAGAQ